MFDPLRPLKYLPWTMLFQASLVTVLIAIALDIGITTLFNLPSLPPLVVRILSSPLGELVHPACSFGVGFLGTTVLERWFKQVKITTATLWALSICIGLWLGLAMFVPYSGLFLPPLDLFPLAFIAIGVFLRGRRHWRWRN